MSNITGYIDCVNVQTDLPTVFMGYNNQSVATLGNITKFLLSDVNTQNVLKNAIATAGKLKTVEVIYEQRGTADDLSDSGIITCEVGEATGETSKLYTIDPADGTSRNWSLKTGELRRRCEADSAYVARQIFQKMNEIIAGVEAKTAAKIALNTGNFASDVDAGNAAGTSTYKEGLGYLTSGAISYGAYEAVSFENMNNDFTQTPVVFGGEKWFKYAKAVGAACCGDLGVDVGLYASNNPMLFAYSREITAALSEQTAAISMIPGVAQFIWANEFENDVLQINNGQLTQGVLMYPDPNLPLMFDYRAEYKCIEGGDKQWAFSLALSHDVVFLPNDMYKSGDRLEGVNGVNQFRICGEAQTCPTPNGDLG
jgi:hypothetical protein